MARSRLSLFARVPKLGKAKTRLVPFLGEEKTHQLYIKLLTQAISLLTEVSQNSAFEVSIALSGGENSEMEAYSRGIALQPQRGDSLGEKMHNHFLDGAAAGYQNQLIIGSDCPFITLGHIHSAFKGLESSPITFGPALDGGYYLIGQSSPIHNVFDSIGWGGPQVLTQSLALVKKLGLPVHLLSELSDIDEPEDLKLLPPHWLED